MCPCSSISRLSSLCFRYIGSFNRLFFTFKIAFVPYSHRSVTTFLDRYLRHRENLFNTSLRLSWGSDWRIAEYYWEINSKKLNPFLQIILLRHFTQKIDHLVRSKTFPDVRTVDLKYVQACGKMLDLTKWSDFFLFPTVSSFKSLYFCTSNTYPKISTIFSTIGVNENR